MQVDECRGGCRWRRSRRSWRCPAARRASERFAVAVREAGRADGHFRRSQRAGATSRRRLRSTCGRSARCSPRRRRRTASCRRLSRAIPSCAKALLLLAMHESRRDTIGWLLPRTGTAGVLDYAFRHFQRAVVLEPCDAAAYDGMARIWRDWGMPDLALERCLSRAALQPEIGRHAQHARDGAAGSGADRWSGAGLRERRGAQSARRVRAQQSVLPRDLERGQTESATRYCESALDDRSRHSRLPATTWRSPRRSGRRAQRRGRRLVAGRSASAQYNVGILRLATGRYPEAAEAFDRAAAAKPSLVIARQRAVQARRAALAIGATMITAEPTAALDLRAPRTLEEAGLSRDLITQLVLKTLHFSGELSGTELSRRLGLPFMAIEPVVDGHQAAASGRDFRRRTRLPRPIATGSPTPAAPARCCSSSRATTSGVAPVPLAAVPRSTWRRSRAAVPHQVDRAKVRDAFSHLVISQRVLDQLGPAVNAGHSMFVYGPPGNGKTVISQAIHNLLDGDILHPACARGRRQHHPLLRSGQSRAAARRRRTTSLDLGERTRSALGALPAADGHGRRRAVARSARAQLQPDARLLPRARSGGRQWRRAGHRRLRPPDVLAARAAEPLDRAAREPRRLPDAADRTEVRLAVHDA